MAICHANPPCSAFCCVPISIASNQHCSILPHFPQTLFLILTTLTMHHSFCSPSAWWFSTTPSPTPSDPDNFHSPTMSNFAHLHQTVSQGALSFSTLIFHDFPWPKNENPWPDLSAQHIFPSKWYTTYECIPELVVTVSTGSTIVKKIKRFIIWHYKWSRVTFTELLTAVVPPCNILVFYSH